MSSRAMASAKNRRTSPFSMGNKTMVPPQPINKTMSGAQRVSQIQGKQAAPSGRSMQRSGGPPPPVPTRGNNSAARASSSISDVGRQAEPIRRELSIPEAFAMLNRKVSMMEEILEDKGFEFENHEMIGTKSSVDVNEKIEILRREIEEATKVSSPNLNSIFKQIQLIKDEKDGEIAQLNNTIHELSEEFREFKNRFEHEGESTYVLGDDENGTLVSYNEDNEDNEMDSSLEVADKSENENVSMVINEVGDIELNKSVNNDSRESEEESVADTVEDVLEDVVGDVVEGVIEDSSEEKDVAC